MISSRISALLCAATMLVSACETPLAPRGAVRLAPSPSYGTLWKTVETCSGLTGDLSNIRWFSTPGAASPSMPEAVGSWWPDGNRIYLNEAYVNNAGVVRHEMLHALERSVDHSARYLKACAGLVTCVGPCVSEAGPQPVGPGNTSPVITASSLKVDVVLLAAQPSDSGYSTVIVKTTNPFNYPVWVRLENPEGIEFNCRRDTRPCGNVIPYGPGAKIPFGAGQMRQRAFVFRDATGSYEIVAGYDSHLAAPLTLVVP